MGLQRYRRVGGDGAQAAILHEQAGRAAGSAGEGLARGDVAIGLGGDVQVFAGVQHGRGRCRQVHRRRRVDQHPGPVDALDRIAAATLAAGGLDRLLAADAARIAAVGLGIDRLDQGIVLLVGGQRPRLALGGGVVDAARRVARAPQQRQGLLCIGLGRARALAGVGRQQHALARAHDGPGVRAQLETAAAPFAARCVIGGLLDQIAQSQLRGGDGARQARAHLAGGVVEQPLAVALAVQALAMPAAERAGMIGLAIHARAPWRQVAVVVELRHHHGLVDVAIEEFHHDFGALARQVMRAPVGAGLGAGHAQPGAGAIVARRVAGVVAVAAVAQAARQRPLAALPRELHLDAQVAPGRDAGILRRHHQGGHALGRRRPGSPGGQQRRGGRLGSEVVAVGAMLQVGGGQRLGGLAAQVVGGLVLDPQQRVAVAAQLVARRARTLRVAIVLGQREDVARHHLAGAAAALEAQRARLVRLQPAVGELFGRGVVRVAAVSVVVVVFQRRQRAGVQRRFGMGAVRQQRPVVPGDAGDGVGADLARRAEARDAVFGFGGVAAMKTQRGGGVGRLRGAGIEHHQAVARAAAVGLAVTLLVVEAEAQPGLGHQPQHEVQVGFPVLGAHRARRQRFGDVEGERGQRVVREHVGQDIGDRLVLEHEAVAPQPQRGQPGRGVQAVTRQPAVGAEGVHAFHHRMPAPPSAVGQQQADADLLAQQRFDVQLGRRGQAVQGQREQFRNAFAQAQAFDDERFAQRRFDLQQAGVLGQRGDIQTAVARGRGGTIDHGAWRCACAVRAARWSGGRRAGRA
ncbi:Uncharacterised protein [Achromobacter xylosoxidans]|nr:Uncharacterised protein [Achromobacter xylosoxidans]